MIILKTKKFVVSAWRDKINVNEAYTNHFILIPMPVVAIHDDIFNKVRGIGFQWLKWFFTIQINTPKSPTIYF